MKFFHVYNEDCIKGLEKNGLINADTGFKIQHCFAVPLAREDLHLERIDDRTYRATVAADFATFTF